MPLSAADLNVNFFRLAHLAHGPCSDTLFLPLNCIQKQLEGAPDPFPSQRETTTRPAPSASANVPVDTDSETLFPSLGSASVNPSTSKVPQSYQPVKAARAVKPVSTPVYTDSLTLAGIDPSAHTTKDGKPKTLGDVLKDVQTKFKVKVDVFSQKTSKETAFTITGSSDSSVQAAKKALTSDLSPTVGLLFEKTIAALTA